MEKSIGKLICFVLRHKPEVIDIKIDRNGWANVDELIEKIKEYKQKEITLQDLEIMVATDNKTRFAFNEDKTKIRANQGHSIDVDVELEQVTPPNVLYHGTGRKYLESIQQDGLIPKSRLYVHLSADTDVAVTVGKRHGDVAIFELDCRSMVRDGFCFISRLIMFG